MLKIIHDISIAIILLLFCRIVSATIDFGVGFQLSLEYGVASVYFSNGSTVDIAKIPGGSSYQQTMRAAYIPGTNTTYFSSRPLQVDRHESGLRTIQQFLHLQTLPNHLQSLRDRLPYWLGGNDSHSLSIVPMLKALKSATESYLETTISAADIVVPFYITKEFIEILHSAAFSASLHIPGFAQDPAGILSLYTYGIGTKPCSNEPGVAVDPDQLVLTVEYARAAFTTLLIYEECAILEDRRILHNTDFGSRQSGSESYRQQLEAFACR